MSNGDPFEGVIWKSAEELGIRGMGWKNEGREQPFDRFPSSLKGEISEILWNLSTQSAGLYLEFESALESIFVRWTLQPSETMGIAPYGAESGRSGVDGYGLDLLGDWRWVGCQEAWQDPHCNGRLGKTPIDGKHRRYRIYLPLMRRVLKFEVGSKTPIQAVSAPSHEPIVYYGTSIVHGAGVCRPGMTHAAQLGRILKREVLNLGFCGRAWCEPIVAEALGRLNSSIFLVDCLPNNSVENLEERLPIFLEKLVSLRPEAKIILIGDRVFGDQTFSPERLKTFQEKNEKLLSLVDSFRQRGWKNVFPCFHPSWYGNDLEGTTDASHPNDLGAWQMAHALAPEIRKYL